MPAVVLDQLPKEAGGQDLCCAGLSSSRPLSGSVRPGKLLRDGNLAKVFFPPEAEASRAILNLQVLSSLTSHTALFPLQICLWIPLPTSHGLRDGLLMDTTPFYLQDSAWHNSPGSSGQPRLAPLLVPNQGHDAALSAAPQTCALQVMGPSSSCLRLSQEIEAEKMLGDG